MKTEKQRVQVYFTLPGKIVWEVQSGLSLWHSTFTVDKKAACYQELTFRNHFQGVGSGCTRKSSKSSASMGLRGRGRVSMEEPQIPPFTRKLRELLLLFSQAKVDSSFYKYFPQQLIGAKKVFFFPAQLTSS